MKVSIASVNRQVVECRRCDRLVAWREATAAHPPARFRRDSYWAKPVPGFGDPEARLLLVGLAPAAHGANRTGRMFTGDRSGDWLYRALHRAGFASQPNSTDRADGMRLTDCYITAAVRCAPPGNRPSPQERSNCLPYLASDLTALHRLKVIVALGGIGWEATLAALRQNGAMIPSPKPRFGHLAEAEIGSLRLIGSYHPSPLNTNTGRLTEEAFDSVFARAGSRLA